jgi:hypothetical protein
MKYISENLQWPSKVKLTALFLRSCWEFSPKKAHNITRLLKYIGECSKYKFNAQLAIIFIKSNTVDKEGIKI